MGKLTDFSKTFIMLVRWGENMATDAHRKAVAKFQATKARVNIWMSPEGKEKLTAYAKTTPEKSVQKYLLRLIKDDAGIDCDPKE